MSVSAACAIIIGLIALCQAWDARRWQARTDRHLQAMLRDATKTMDEIISLSKKELEQRDIKWNILIDVLPAAFAAAFRGDVPATKTLLETALVQGQDLKDGTMDEASR